MLSGQLMEKHIQVNIVLFLIVLVEQTSREHFNVPVSNFMGVKAKQAFYLYNHKKMISKYLEKFDFHLLAFGEEKKDFPHHCIITVSHAN